MKLRPFELVLIVVFGSLIVLALILLRSYNPAPEKNVTDLGDGVSVWGVLPASTFDSLLDKVSIVDEGFKSVSYRYIPPEDFDTVLLNALADQEGPDLLFLPHDRLVENRSRLQSIKYESFPIRNFRNLYIDGAEIFALSDGLYGYPVAVDPIVMYFNRDIFSTNGFLQAPSTWEEIVNNFVPSLITRDYNRNIQRAAIAMGEYRNIKNAFPVLSLLLLQGGSSLVEESQDIYQIRLDETQNSSGGHPFFNAAAFFTNFSNTNNTLYSWNRSLRLDRDMFLSEDLALYFGFASEGRELAGKNPNLSFDVAEVPQSEASTVKRTYGRFYGFAMLKTSNNKVGAMQAIKVLSSEENAKQLSDGYNFAPVYRTSLSSGSNDIYGSIGYASAVYARGWLNPDLDKINEVLMGMLDDINSNRLDIAAAARDAISRIRQIY